MSTMPLMSTETRIFLTVVVIIGGSGLVFMVVGACRALCRSAYALFATALDGAARDMRG